LLTPPTIDEHRHPDGDTGEIIDKGYLNQSTVLSSRAAMVDAFQ